LNILARRSGDVARTTVIAFIIKQRTDRPSIAYKGRQHHLPYRLYSQVGYGMTISSHYIMVVSQTQGTYVLCPLQSFLIFNLSQKIKLVHGGSRKSPSFKRQRHLICTRFFHAKWVCLYTVCLYKSLTCCLCYFCYICIDTYFYHMF